MEPKEPPLNPPLVKKLVCQREAVNDQTEMLAAATGGSQDNPIEVDAVTKRRYCESSRRNFERRRQLRPTQKRACTRCRKGPHVRQSVQREKLPVTGAESEDILVRGV